HVLDGGFGSEVLEYNAVHALKLSVCPIAIPSQFVTHGDHKTLLKQTGLDIASVAQVIRISMQHAGTIHER
ncbi:MAG TPA: 1-deoxy-D-xylulose-5-phosphate synthase, partial [Candidatus Limiplasma sp.]|nr:1-deoxy-D-xylulose-5-phosphate synthase [Candidatus Limiplasma sp.]